MISKMECSQSQRLCRMESQGKILESLILIFLGSKVTAGGECSHEIRCLLFGRKAITNLNSMLKSRDITLLTKAYIVKAMVFLISHVQMWELRHKETECRRMDAFEQWCWRKLESPLDSKDIKPDNPKGNQPWIFIKGLMLNLKLQCSGHLMWRASSLEKTLMLGKIEGRRRRGR